MVKEQEWLPARSEPGNHITDPYIERMAFLFGRWQVGKVSHMKETPVVFLPCQGVLATA